MKLKRGDLIQAALLGEVDVLVHGANCLHTMGAGVARLIKERFPAAYQADLCTVRGDRSKLGTVSLAEVINLRGDTLTIVNAYTQFGITGPLPRVDYGAITKCFTIIRERFGSKRIGIPMIGAGLGGGDWGQVVKAIELAGQFDDLTVYRLG